MIRGLTSPHTRRIVNGFIFLTISAGGFAMLQASRQNASGMAMPTDPGPFALPAICLTAIGVTGIVLLLLGFLHRETPPHNQPVRMRIDYLRPVLFLISLMLLPWLFDLIGTTSAIVVFSFIWMAGLNATTTSSITRRLLTAAIFAALAGMLVEVIFIRILALPLP